MNFKILIFLSMRLSLSNETLFKNQGIKFIGDRALEEIVSQECLSKIEPEIKVCQDKNLEYSKDPEYISLVKEYQDDVTSGKIEQIQSIQEKMTNYSCCLAWKSLPCLKDAFKVFSILFSHLFIV